MAGYVDIQAPPQQPAPYYAAAPVNSATPYYIEGRKATVNCIIMAANKHAVAANVLLAIWEQEGGPHNKIVVHPNGAVDVGEMQWNRKTIKSQYAKYGITEHHLKSDGCYAADLTAQRLAGHIADGKFPSYWKRVAMYHSANEPYNSIYAKSIKQRAAGWEVTLTKHFRMLGKTINTTLVR